MFQYYSLVIVSSVITTDTAGEVEVSINVSDPPPAKDVKVIMRKDALPYFRQHVKAGINGQAEKAVWNYGDYKLVIIPR